jgi:hypothetical protein
MLNELIVGFMILSFIGFLAFLLFYNPDTH